MQLGEAIAVRRHSFAYVTDEQEACAARRGIWAGSFLEPADWRRRHSRQGEAMYIGFFSVVAIAVTIILWRPMRENPTWFPSVESGTRRRVAGAAFQLWIVTVALWFVIVAIVFEVPTRGIDLKFWPAYLASFFAPPLIVLTIGACIAWACCGLGRMARGA